MRRYAPAPTGYSFGPGSITPMVKTLIWTNVGMFVLMQVAPILTPLLGLTPAAVFGRMWIWQPVTYLFLHGGFTHILFNMLALWMFGTELERLWGSSFFLRYYFVTGVGAGAAMLVASLVPSVFGEGMYVTPTIGASGSVYGLLMAFAIFYPTRPLFMFPFPIPIPAKVLRADHRRVRVLLVVQRGGRRYRAHGAPRRSRRRLCLPEARRGRSRSAPVRTFRRDGRDQVPLLAVEDGPTCASGSTSIPAGATTATSIPAGATTGTRECTDSRQRPETHSHSSRTGLNRSSSNVSASASA